MNDCYVYVCVHCMVAIKLIYLLNVYCQAFGLSSSLVLIRCCFEY